MFVVVTAVRAPLELFLPGMLKRLECNNGRSFSKVGVAGLVEAAVVVAVEATEGGGVSGNGPRSKKVSFRNATIPSMSIAGGDDVDSRARRNRWRAVERDSHQSQASS